MHGSEGGFLFSTLDFFPFRYASMDFCCC